MHLLRGQFLCHLASLESYSESIFYSTSGAGGCRSLKLPNRKAVVLTVSTTTLEERSFLLLVRLNNLETITENRI